MDIALPKSDFITYPAPGSGYAFNTRHFNSCQIEATFPAGTSTFTKVNSKCTLAMYGGDNATAINSYDQKHTDFYIYPVSGSTFEYQIIPNGSGKTLIVTNPLNGNQIYYNNSNAFMSAREADAKKSLLVFANPVKDNLTVENIENDLSVQVFNMLGQKIYEGKSTDKKIKIDTQNFAIGQYILMIKGEKAYKFIKE